MPTLEQVRQALYAALDEINADLPAEAKISMQPETVLFGVGGGLDSLALTTFMLAAEAQVGTQLGVDVVLANEDALERPEEVFGTVESLARYVLHLIETT